MPRGQRGRFRRSLVPVENPLAAQVGGLLSPSFPKWGFGNAPFRAQLHCVAGGGSGASFLDQPLTAKHSFPRCLLSQTLCLGTRARPAHRPRLRRQTSLDGTRADPGFRLRQTGRTGGRRSLLAKAAKRSFMDNASKLVPQMGSRRRMSPNKSHYNMPPKLADRIADSDLFLFTGGGCHVFARVLAELMPRENYTPMHIVQTRPAGKSNGHHVVLQSEEYAVE